jgi:hypothetical protein
MPQSKEHGEISPSLNISFPDVGTVKNIDEIVSSVFSSPKNFQKSIILDFSQTIYIELASLMYILSLCIKRARSNLYTKIKLPENKRVRDFLRYWHFSEAFTESVGITFWNSVIPGDRKYFGEDIDLTSPKYAGKPDLDSNLHQQLLKYYLPIITFNNLSNNFNSSLAFAEADRWKRQAVSSILEKHLQGPHGYFASRVVFEAMMNAIRHPNARLIHTASRFAALDMWKKYSKGHLTIIWWDDGTSIIDTLRYALRNGCNINLGTSSVLKAEYTLQREGPDGKKVGNPVHVPSSYNPDNDTPDDLLLLSAIFPGITRDIAGENHITDPELGKEDTAGSYDPLANYKRFMTLPGMGLYLLVNTAVKVYKGQVSFRTKEFFMNIKNPPHKSRYDYAVKIRGYSDQFNFLGNMLTVRLPLKEN